MSCSHRHRQSADIQGVLILWHSYALRAGGTGSVESKRESSRPVVKTESRQAKQLRCCFTDILVHRERLVISDLVWTESWSRPLWQKPVNPGSFSETLEARSVNHCVMTTATEIYIIIQLQEEMLGTRNTEVLNLNQQTYYQSSKPMKAWQASQAINRLQRVTDYNE